MIKFVLVFIAIILMVLGIYTYTNQPTEKSTPTPTVSQKKPEVKKTEKVSVVAPKVTEKKSSAKNITVKSPKVVSQEKSEEMVDTEEIGKGLTLEGIENTDVSDEERQRMKDTMVYNQSLHIDNSKPLSDEEILKQIEEDLNIGHSLKKEK